jgi:hypothetical protein
LVYDCGGVGLAGFGSILFGSDDRGAVASALRDSVCLAVGRVIGTGLAFPRVRLPDLAIFVDRFLVFLFDM